MDLPCHFRLRGPRGPFSLSISPNVEWITPTFRRSRSGLSSEATYIVISDDNNGITLAPLRGAWVKEHLRLRIEAGCKLTREPLTVPENALTLIEEWGLKDVIRYTMASSKHHVMVIHNFGLEVWMVSKPLRVNLPLSFRQGSLWGFTGISQHDYEGTYDYLTTTYRHLNLKFESGNVYNHSFYPLPEGVRLNTPSGVAVLLEITEVTEITSPDHPAITVWPGVYLVIHPRPAGGGD